MASASPNNRPNLPPNDSFDESLWNLLEKARRPDLSPDFAQRVLSTIQSGKHREGHQIEPGALEAAGNVLSLPAPEEQVAESPKPQATNSPSANARGKQRTVLLALAASIAVTLSFMVLHNGNHGSLEADSIGATIASTDPKDSSLSDLPAADLLVVAQLHELLDSELPEPSAP